MDWRDAFEERGIGYRRAQQRALCGLLRGKRGSMISAAIAAGCRDIALPALNGRLRVRRVGRAGRAGRMADYQRFERRSEWTGRRRTILKGGREMVIERVEDGNDKRVRIRKRLRLFDAAS